MVNPPTIIHSEYDSRAYTAANSAKFNGFSTPDHVVFDGDTVRFFGYDVKANMDMIFTEEYDGGYLFDRQFLRQKHRVCLKKQGVP